MWLYVRSRRTLTGVALTCVFCAALPLLGMLEIPFPSEGSGTGSAYVPAWRILAIGVPFGAVLFCHSPFGEIEAATSRNWRRAALIVLVTSTAACAALYVIMCALVFGDDMAVMALRSIIGWMGITVLAGRVFSWRTAWIGPLIILPLMIFWGIAEPPHYHWWEFTARPPADRAAWLTAVALAAAGGVGWTYDRWRWLPVKNLLLRLAGPLAAK